MANAVAEQAIIKQIMADKGIDPGKIPSEDHIRDPSNPDSIKRSRRYFRTKGFANFPRHITFCGRRWPSAHAWCVTDLKKQRICHRYSQECQSCEGAGKPVFDAESIMRMAGWACNQYLIRMGLLDTEPPSDKDAVEESSQPHDRLRCEMCRLLGSDCWK